MGDIISLASRYRDEGADELVFYDITASPHGRTVDRSWVNKVAGVLDIPFCVAGGIRSLADAETILNLGADKISINTPALERPGLIEELAKRFGAQCVVIGIDSSSENGNYTNLYKFIENLNDPYSNEVNSDFQKGPTEDEKVHQTFCGT